MKADINKLSYIARKPGKATTLRDSDSWFTPKLYIDLVKKVMGCIDLDPFSSKEANKLIEAKRYFDINFSAFENNWFDSESNPNVFMNPPYSRGLIEKSVDYFLFNKAHMNQAIVLVNNATETKWFQKLLLQADMACFPSKRIAFENIDGKSVSGNTRGQAFLYYGRRKMLFKKTFEAIGVVLAPVR